jgi:hypothetical protein
MESDLVMVEICAFQQVASQAPMFSRGVPSPRNDPHQAKEIQPELRRLHVTHLTTFKCTHFLEAIVHNANKGGEGLEN